MVDKVKFDVANPQHVDVYKNFLSNAKWGHSGCPFILEDPFLDIPSMLSHKYVRYILGV